MTAGTTRETEALNLTCKALHQAVTPDLFRDMTLKYTYGYDIGSKALMVPKLVRLPEEQPQLAEYVKAVRVQIVPIPERMGFNRDHGGMNVSLPDPKYQDPATHYACWSTHLRRRLADHLYSPCAREQPDMEESDFGPNRMKEGTRHAFDRVCGSHMRATWDGADEIVDIETGETREILAYYIIRTLRHVVVPLRQLEHMEAGLWRRPDPEHLGDDGYEILRRYGVAFATAVMLQTLPHRVYSLRIHGLQLASDKEGRTAAEFADLSVPWPIAQFSAVHI